jgi:hypothetical protein
VRTQLTRAPESPASSWPATHNPRGSVTVSARARIAASSCSFSACQRDGGALGGSVIRLPVCANSAPDAASSAATRK